MKSNYLQMLGFVIVFLLLGTGFLAVNQLNTAMHENVHEAIAYNHGCLNVTKKINIWGDSWVLCEEYGERSDEVRNQKELLDSLNEIVGYNVLTILFAMFVCTGVIVCGLFFRNIGEG